MVAPITGPHRSIYSSHPFYRDQFKYKQTKPFAYDLQLPYEVHFSKVVFQSGGESSQWAVSESDPGLIGNPDVNQVKIVAYDRLKGMFSDAAEIGAALVTVGQSLTMIEARALQLARAYKALRHGRFDSFLKELSMPATTKKPVHKGAAGQWLEYSYGWSPLVDDIAGAVEVLQAPLPTKDVKGTGKSTRVEYFAPPNASYTRYLRIRSTTSRVKYGARVKVSNPDLWLANQLGFTNPLSVVWEVVPFSFVVDWFANVQQYLELRSDFYGLSVESSFTTTYVTRSLQYEWTSYGFVGKYDIAQVVRVPGIITPELGFRALKAPSGKRAANAIALLVGFMKG